MSTIVDHHPVNKCHATFSKLFESNIRSHHDRARIFSINKAFGSSIQFGDLVFDHKSGYVAVCLNGFLKHPDLLWGGVSTFKSVSDDNQETIVIDTDVTDRLEDPIAFYSEIFALIQEDGTLANSLLNYRLGQIFIDLDRHQNLIPDEIRQYVTEQTYNKATWTTSDGFNASFIPDIDGE